MSFYQSVEEFVTRHGGDHAIKKVLVANNGVGAIKAIRSIRKWAFEIFGNERAIQFVVMTTPEDFNANAEFVRAADEIVDVPGGTNNNNYANINLICEIAMQHQVDAVMPMWGHASENPLLPTTLLQLPRKITFIGPAAEPMQALGDKIGSTIIAQSAGVPTIAWNGDGLTVDYKNVGIPSEVYNRANVTTAEEALSCAERIGYPVMIKASEGGGGKGIRKVTRSEDVLNSYRQVQSEIPGSPIFVMKMASKARHLEVQLLADKYGEAIALSGRDCSVQRRHQKIIEEGPPTAAPPSVFKRMEQAAVSLAKTVGYCNAGTVEYLYIEETQEFAFLELNPRLQVEHPVTENILGINLPACQLQVAMGLPLHRIADIRKLYGRHIHGTDTIDFDYNERVVTPRHCIAVRVTAENPDAGFQPTSGRITELQFRSSIDVWGYFSVDNNGKIHEFADSQFGHIFASGRDREGARRAMIVALKELQIRGDIRTTIEYVIKMIQSDDFTNNKIDTMWLDHRIERSKELSTSDRLKYCPPSTLVALCGASLQSFRHFQQRGDEFISMLQVGQIPNKEVLSPQVDIDLIFDNVKYKTHCVLSGANTIIVDCNQDQQSVNIRSLSDGGYIFDISGKNHIAYINEESGGNLRMILDGHTCMFTPEYDPTRLTSSVAGKFARQLVDDGSHLNAGDVYVEIEVMKMYMPLKVPESGIIHFQMSEGAVLSPGDVIALMTLDYPDKVVTSEQFTGTLTVPSRVECSTSALPHVTMRNALAELNKVLDGYYKPEVDIDTQLDTFLQGFDELLVPVYELEEAMSVLRGRIDATLFQKISEVNNNYKTIIEAVSHSDKNSILPPYPAVKILTYLHEYIQAQPADKRGPIITQTTPLWNVVEPYIYTTEVRQLVTFQQMIEKYLKVERLFDNMSFTDVVSGLRKDHSNNLTTVLSLCRSHVNLTAKNQLILRVMEEMRSLPITTSTNIATNVTVNIPLRHELNTRGVKLVLKDLAKLRQPVYIHVSFTANLIVINQNNLRPETRRQRLHEVITSALTTGDAVGQGDRLIILKRFVDSNLAIKDLLIDALRQDKDYRIAIMELYLLKIYQATHNLDHMISGHSLKDDVISEISSWIKFDFVTKHIKAIENPSSNSSSASSTPAKRRFSSQGIADLTMITASPLYTPVTDPTTLMSMSSKLNHPLVSGKRQGIMATIDSTSDLARLFPLAIKKITPTHSGNVNAVHIILTKPITNCTDDEMSKVLQDFLSTQIGLLHDHGIRRVTFLSVHPHDSDKDKKKVTQGGTALVRTRRSMSFNSSVTSSLGGTISIFTYRRRTNYMEDSLFRHIEAPHAYHLDLPRLSNFDVSLESIPSTSGNVFLYRARLLDNPKGPIRFFARLVSYAIENNTSDAESLFVEALDILGIVIGREEASGRRNSSTANHVFLNIVAPDNVVQLDFYHTEIRRICTKYWEKMVRLAINSVEVKLNGRLSIDATPLSLRLVASNPTGFVLKVDKYYEEIQGMDILFRTLSTSPNGETVSAGPWDGLSIHTPYEVSQKFEKQRADAMASSDTLYVYDWPSLFESGVERLWFDYRNATPDKKKKHSSQRALATYLSVHEVEKEVFHCQELVLCDATTKEPLLRGWTAKEAQENGAVILPIDRSPGMNDAGMVAWLAKLRTPECPEGRELVIISNDITFQAGSFGTKEDIIFYKASEYARVRGIPRFFLAANSGARIGMAQSLKDKFQVAWTDEKDPSKGFKHIYLKSDDYNKLLEKFNGKIDQLPIRCSTYQVPNSTEVRYIVTDIIGEEPDLGVENLMGSGLIAGETARAYDEIFTLTLVVGRTVGIGAYLVRLGQRTVQKTRNSPIILTGYQALNKLMGREIYTTNDQLGGPMIMFPNGVSHMLAETHMDSISKALTWLSYVPVVKGASLPVINISAYDSIDREVDYFPPKGLSYDPRLLLCGEYVDDNTWTSGFFDKDSFIETLDGWAKTVIVGRGRLGGIPMGLIVTENRTAEATKPADPADITSREKMVQQAGGVWFPDSAYKTAQALRDFNREGLPCIILANWRGFSGGQRDMFDEVLKFGSMIVDALVAYQQPLFVYIPPFAELRGGAWVVVDSTINSDVMEFYAAEDARGGVLEAAGAASIKFRDRDVLATAHRVDHVLIDMTSRLNTLKYKETIDLKTSEEITTLEKQIKQRERMLFGVFQQVAVHFADLHDTPGRMEAKGVIRKQVQWKQSRRFFYWRLRRRLHEFECINRIKNAMKMKSNPTDSLSAAAITTTTTTTTTTAIINRKEIVSQLKAWFLTLSPEHVNLWQDDQEFITWTDQTENRALFDAYVNKKRDEIIGRNVTSQLTELLHHGSDSFKSILSTAMNQLSSEDRTQLLTALKSLS